MDDFIPIAEHGLIGDLQTSALVTTGGTIDWFCCPRFDSPSIFASLLDRGKGGYFSIAPEGDDYVSKQLYLPGTAILITRFITPNGVGELVDFMPVIKGAATDRHRLVRIVRVVRGEVRFVVDCQPRFNYGLSAHKIETNESGVTFHGEDGTTINVSISRRAGIADSERVLAEPHGDGVRAVLAATAGQSGGLVLESAPTGARRRSPTRRSTSCSSRPGTSGGSGSGARSTRVAGVRASSVRP